MPRYRLRVGPWGPANKGKLGALRGAPAKKRKERPVSGTVFHRLRNGRTPRLGETALLRNGRTPRGPLGGAQHAEAS